MSLVVIIDKVVGVFLSVVCMWLLVNVLLVLYFLCLVVIVKGFSKIGFLFSMLEDDLVEVVIVF